MRNIAIDHSGCNNHKLQQQPFNIMSIIVKELNIKLNVNEELSGEEVQISGADEDKIIARCLEQVFQILEDKKDR